MHHSTSGCCLKLNRKAFTKSDSPTLRFIHTTQSLYGPLSSSRFSPPQIRPLITVLLLATGLPPTMVATTWSSVTPLLDGTPSAALRTFRMALPTQLSLPKNTAPALATVAFGAMATGMCRGCPPITLSRMPTHHRRHLPKQRAIRPEPKLLVPAVARSAWLTAAFATSVRV